MARVVVVYTATPSELRFTVASGVLPSKKATEPSCGSLGVGITVAVIVTSVPVAAGFGETVSNAVVTTGAETPVPLIEKVCVPVPSTVALSTRVTRPEKAPRFVVGANSTPRIQLWPGASIRLEVHVVSGPFKSKLVAAPRLEKFRAAEPVFVTVTS